MFSFLQSMTDGPERRSGWMQLLSGLALSLAIFTASNSHAQSTTTIHIDASGAFTEPAPGRFGGGSANSPAGVIFGLNSRSRTLDWKPWLPVMGEFHFSRYPRAQWEEE